MHNGRKTIDQFKNLVAFNAAIIEADEEIQMIQKEMATQGFDKNYMSALDELNQKFVYYRYKKVKIFSELYDKIEILEDEQEHKLALYNIEI